MSDINDLVSGLRVASQIPLDKKVHSPSESSLSNLGTANNLAFTYYKGLVVFCVLESTRWEWKEVLVDTPNKLMVSDFIYPPNHIVYEVDYSEKRYNFVLTTFQGEQGEQGPPGADGEDGQDGEDGLPGAPGSNNLQKPITEDYILTDADNNYVLWLEHGATNITITVPPSGLRAKFNVGFYHDESASGEVTVVNALGVTIHNPIGLKSKGPKWWFYLERKDNTQIYALLGNTKP